MVAVVCINEKIISLEKAAEYSQNCYFTTTLQIKISYRE